MTTDNPAPIPLGTYVPNYGRIGMVQTTNGERMYGITGLRGVVAMLPEDVVRRALSAQEPAKT